MCWIESITKGDHSKKINTKVQLKYQPDRFPQGVTNSDNRSAVDLSANICAGERMSAFLVFFRFKKVY
jgi:hypothetical protein